MATNRYNSLIEKVRSWSNKPEAQTVADSVIEDCLGYSADECYRLLKIPPLESSIEYTIESADNVGDGDTTNSMYNSAYTSFAVPEDLVSFVYIRTKVDSSNTVSSNRVFNEIVDRRGFFDIFYETYSAYNWMWSEGKIFIRPEVTTHTSIGASIRSSHQQAAPSLCSTTKSPSKSSADM